MRARPAALGTAYNGASFAGLIFSPLWVAHRAAGLSGCRGDRSALSPSSSSRCSPSRYFARTPAADGARARWRRAWRAGRIGDLAAREAAAGTALWRDFAFITLAAGAALSLFAQIGLITHLYSLLVPALGTEWAGLVMGIGTGAGMGGRMLVGWLMPVGADRRLVACISYAVQIAGTLTADRGGGRRTCRCCSPACCCSGSASAMSTSMPPLIAQVEFVKDDVPRVVALVVAIGQATYAFAPAAFGLIREFARRAAGGAVFAAAALVYALAIGALLIGRGRDSTNSSRAYPCR